MTRTQDAPAQGKRETYHHGNLRHALIAAAMELIGTEGVDAVSVREVARRAGVSPGAPFRHFSSRAALLTAVAEQAGQMLRDAVDEAVAASAGQAPIARLAALGRAYLGWAHDHPLHFRIVSDRSLIDYDASDSLRANNEAIRAHMRALLGSDGGEDVSPDVIEGQLLAARALVYGLARMAADGHLAEWSGDRPAAEAEHAALEVLLAGIVATSRRQTESRAAERHRRNN